MRRLLYLVVPCLTVLCGCYGTDKGVEVPVDEIYFPVGLALDPRPNPRDTKRNAPQFLYAVSSDFDLQYNGGAVQSYKLDDLEQAMPAPCSDPDGLCPRTARSKKDELGQPILNASPEAACAEGVQGNEQRLLYPGLCKSLTPQKYQANHVKIGAFATDAVIRQESGGDDPPRLFVPVRGDATLHFLDIGREGQLECGQANNDGACDQAHRAGEEPTDSARGITLNAEPFAADADPQGHTLVVTNQTSGTASLFVTDDWKVGPKLQYALADATRIPKRAIGVVNVPRAAYTPPDADPTAETYMMTFRDSAQVRLMRFVADDGSSPARPFLADGGGVSIDANSSGTDSRGIAIDDSLRKDAEERCAGDSKCLEQAALVPLDVYVANRSPASLLIGRTQPPAQYPYFYDTVPLTLGPSKVVVGKIQTPNGDETRVFVVCFDSRRIFIYDPKRSRIEAEIFTARGPHALAVDTQRRRLYVGHFTDSYIGVYSLDLDFPDTYGTMLGSLGTPKAPRSSK